MRKILFSIAISLLCLGSISAQTFISKINHLPVYQPNKAAVKDSLKILAVMVEFQQDKDASTIGNGKFGSIYSKDYGKNILDPLPFDRAYFSAHLEFAKNYYKKVSNNKLNISYNVLPKVYTVSKTIREYSPAPKSSDFTGLGNLSKEVWSKVDSSDPGINFDDYDLFVIFHAGVGGGISLPGSLGNERDLPSVYLGYKALKTIYGSDFTGFPVMNGTKPILNSLILPCTESRDITSYGTTYLFQLTINGLIVSNIASYLGLPDLYNTKTGLSAIGRFGLMDGQSIFCYAGAIPPEPSAWEKIFLGWASPVTVSPGNYSVNLAARLAAGISDTTILKVPISSTEYYLIENRERDVNKNGASVTYYLDGNKYTKTYLKDTTGFNSASADSVTGVITDVDEFDWAVPGNGIVIWHIDESIINAKIDDNAINADENNRGVDVEEADGVQDIGKQYTTILGDVVTGEGTEDDFWFKTNTSTLYKNKFDKTTRPNTNSNSGANSLISISGFSDISNKMSFQIAYGDSIIKPVFVSQIRPSSNRRNLTFVGNSNSANLALLTDSYLDLYKIDSALEFSTDNNFSTFKPAAVNNGESRLVIGAYFDKTKNKSAANIYQSTANGSRTISLMADEEFIGSPVVYTNISDNLLYAAIPCKSSSNFVIKLPQTLAENATASKLQNIFSEPVYKTVKTDDNYEAYLLKGKWANSNKKQFSANLTAANDIAVFKDSKGENISVIKTVPEIVHSTDTITSAVYIVDQDGNLLNQVWVSNQVDSLSTIAIGDLKNDGENYIVCNNGKKIEAINQTGARADHFPFNDPLGIGFTGTPIVYDFEGDKKPEIISVTNDGRIFAIDGGTGKIIPGFPISTGAKLNSVPVVFNNNGKTYLAATSGNYLYEWIIGSTEGTAYWSEENGNGSNNSYIGAASKSNYVNTFFPSEKVYNYPNPAYDNYTNIRYYVSEDSKINIKIFDLAGDYVAQLNNTATGGMENETVWRLNNIQSGIYLARVEATGVSGKTENKIIKIAVVK